VNRRRLKLRHSKLKRTTRSFLQLKQQTIHLLMSLQRAKRNHRTLLLRKYWVRIPLQHHSANLSWLQIVNLILDNLLVYLERLLLILEDYSTNQLHLLRETYLVALKNLQRRRKAYSTVFKNKHQLRKACLVSLKHQHQLREACLVPLNHLHHLREACLVSPNHLHHLREALMM